MNIQKPQNVEARHKVVRAKSTGDVRNVVNSGEKRTAIPQNPSLLFVVGGGSPGEEHREGPPIVKSPEIYRKLKGTAKKLPRSNTRNRENSQSPLFTRLEQGAHPEDLEVISPPVDIGSNANFSRKASGNRSKTPTHVHVRNEASDSLRLSASPGVRREKHKVKLPGASHLVSENKQHHSFQDPDKGGSNNPSQKRAVSHTDGNTSPTLVREGAPPTSTTPSLTREGMEGKTPAGGVKKTISIPKVSWDSVKTPPGTFVLKQPREGPRTWKLTSRKKLNERTVAKWKLLLELSDKKTPLGKEVRAAGESCGWAAVWGLKDTLWSALTGVSPEQKQALHTLFSVEERAAEQGVINKIVVEVLRSPVNTLVAVGKLICVEVAQTLVERLAQATDVNVAMEQANSISSQVPLSVDSTVAKAMDKETFPQASQRSLLAGSGSRGNDRQRNGRKKIQRSIY